MFCITFGTTSSGYDVGDTFSTTFGDAFSTTFGYAFGNAISTTSRSRSRITFDTTFSEVFGFNFGDTFNTYDLHTWPVGRRL